MRKILKASALVGSGSAAAIISGIIKSKLMAVLVGPEGVGLFGLLQSVVNTAGTITGMGFSNSGVRQIAEARAAGDESKLAYTRKALSISSRCLGLIGALALVVFRGPIARTVIGSSNYSGAFYLLGLAVFAVTVAGSQAAFINGLHRLGDLTRINIITSFAGMAIAVLAIWIYGISGIIIAVASAPVVTLAVSGIYNRKIKTMEVSLSWEGLSGPLRRIITLGFIIMVTALMTVGTQFAVRVLVTATLGMSATGHFQAAWSISMLYLGFVLGAMGADYYPRLVAGIGDQGATNKIVNEQTEVALLLAGPVILGMLTFTRQVVAILYSGDFGETSAILRWQILGDLFKVIAWPMGFILLAQGRSRAFFFAELSWNAIYLFLVWIGLKKWGLEATGVAFLISYIIFAMLIWTIVSRSGAFQWSRKNSILMAILVLSSMIIAFSWLYLGAVPLIVGMMLTAVMGLYSIKRISGALGVLSGNAVP